MSLLDAADLDAVRDRLARSPGDLTPHRVAEALREAGRPVGDAAVLAAYETLRRDVVGAGPLEPLLREPHVTDVLVNGPARVYLDRGGGLELTPVTFPDDEAVRRLAQRLAALGGRRLDDATPYVDLRLPDGTRFHAVLAPLARPGTVISLRVPRRRAFSLDDLVAARLLDPGSAELLDEIVAARLAFLVSGGTGSGKTTLLAALLARVPAEERIVVVEDASELRPDHAHVVALEGRPPNIEGAGAVDVRTLVRQALRMRPDRLVVGECGVRRECPAVLAGHFRPGRTLRVPTGTLVRRPDSSRDTSASRAAPGWTLPGGDPPWQRAARDRGERCRTDFQLVRSRWAPLQPGRSWSSGRLPASAASRLQAGRALVRTGA